MDRMVSLNPDRVCMHSLVSQSHTRTVASKEPLHMYPEREREREREKENDR